MFEKLLSSFSRLVRSSEEPGGAVGLESQRRVRVRYPSSSSLGDELEAGVLQVSRGGIGLLIERALETGKLLSVELPSPSGEGPFRVLAYVMHVSAQPGGRWAVCCTFAAELSDEDLGAFGARRQRTAPGDQRTWMRFTCPVQAAYQLVRDAAYAPSAARVVDISPAGIGLETDQSLEVGTLLSVELHGAGHDSALTILASVTRVTPRDNGGWTLGCHFIRELSDQELQALR